MVGCRQTAGPLQGWLQDTIEEAEQKAVPFHPVVVEFQQMIEGDPVLHMYFTQMFEEQPSCRVLRRKR